MRDARLFSAVAIMLGITHAAQDSGLAGAIATLPNCALTCIGATLPTSRCSLLDQECICTDATLLLHVEGCVLSSCSMQESLATKNITMIACGASLRRKSENTRLSNIVLSTITATIGITRLLYNATLSHIGWGSDDSMLFALLIAGAPSVVIVDRMSIPNGLGKDVWTLKLSEIEAFVRSVYALEILYFLQVALAKATLLLFFLKIFPAQRTRQLILSTLWLDALYGAVFTFVAIFSCQPIHYYWTRFARTAEGKCVDMNALVWANASISIALDVWMLVLPLYEVYGLKMSWRKRLSVALMFFVGTFVTIVSIIRLRSLITFAKGQNPTWDQADVVNWSNIEINVGIICACMPTLRAMMMRLLADHRGQRKSESPHIESHSAYRSDRSFKKDGSVDSELATIGNESLGKIMIEAQNT